VKLQSVKSGDVIGRWTALIVVSGPGKARWICRCACGTEKVVDAYNLKIGVSLSCGCLRIETVRTHNEGVKRTPEYWAWHAMIQRCENPRVKHWENYGGRGITVCSTWRADYRNFLVDMGRKPTPKHSLDRYPDNDGNYGPGNCRWATQKEQMRNTRLTKLTPEKVADIRRRRAAGETTTSLGAEFGINPATVTRISQGKAWA
jgi:hypothetical protein